MNKELTCNQVSALINFYLNGRLNPRLKQDFDNHLTKCITCRKKVEELKKIMSKFNHTENEEPKEELQTKFMHNLSAYVDNELNSNENIKIKKITISNPNARKELESIYKFQKLLHSAYQKTKNDSKFDYSKTIVSKIQEPLDYTTNYFLKLSIGFVALIMAIIGGFVYLYL